jgi:hypothetical protein
MSAGIRVRPLDDEGEELEGADQFEITLMDLESIHVY